MSVAPGKKRIPSVVVVISFLMCPEFAYGGIINESNRLLKRKNSMGELLAISRLFEGAVCFPRDPLHEGFNLKSWKLANKVM